MQADLRLCWPHILHCWKSHALAQILLSAALVIAALLAHTGEAAILYVIFKQKMCLEFWLF